MTLMDERAEDGEAILLQLWKAELEEDELVVCT